MATMAVVKLERSADDDDSWLYGGPAAAAAAAATVQKVADPKSPTVSEAPVDSRLSADAAVFEPRKQSDDGESAAAGENSKTQESFDDSNQAPETAANTSAADEEADVENADDDDSEDDVQVTIGDIKSQPFDTSLSKFKTPYQQQHSQGSTTTASKPPSKGIDLDAVGTISGVPVYEYDIESIKMEDKPWRKPGADITDYFNYGFNEDTWTKYCEKQRRLRIENSSHKSGNLIFVHGTASHRPEPAKSVDLVNSGDMNSYSNSGPLRKLNNHQPMHKNSSTIDVIGSTTWDSRRPQPQDFVVESVGEPIEYQQISSVTTMIPMSISIPPPMLNLPPPDFGMPPPPGAMPPRAMAPPPRIGLPPPGLIAPPQILVGPPPGFPPPSLGGPGFEPFFRGGPPPPSHDRRPPPGFPDRPPPFGFEGPFGGPPPFGAQPGAPPGWDNRGGGAGGGPGGVGGGGAAASGGDRAPPSWDFRNSPARSDTDLSSSLGDEPDRDRRSSPIKHRPRETYEHQERESRQRERSRSRDRSRLRYVEQDRKDIDHERSRDSKDRGRDYERDRGRESYRGRDDRDRSRERDRHRRSSRDQRESYDRDRGRDRERRHHRDREDHHSRRREENEDRHKSKHKKEKKVKQEPMDDGDNANGTPTHSDENAKA